MRAYNYVLIAFGLTSHSATFNNLDFQSPNVQRISGSEGLVKYIIPGWSLQYGGVNQDIMFYNGISLLFPSAQLLGPRVPRIGDEFTFTIKSGIVFDGSNAIMGPASIYQIGQVPESAKSIHFTALMLRIFENLHVSLAGPPVARRSTPDGGETGF